MPDKLNQEGRYKPKNIVERAIDIGGDGKPAEFARKLSAHIGYEISRQMVNNWKGRGEFSRDVINAAHALTNLPIVELVQRRVPLREKRREKDQD